MNANALLYHELHMNILMEEAEKDRLARLVQHASGNTLRQRLLRPVGHRLVVLGQRLMDDSQTNEDGYAEAERMAGYVS